MENNKSKFEVFKNWINNINYKYNEEVVFRDTGSTIMAYVQSTGDMCELNPVAGDILELLSNNLSLNDIIFKRLPEIYDVDIVDVYQDIEYILNRFIEIKIIEVIE